MPKHASAPKSSFFGTTALAIAIISAVFLGASLAVSQLPTTPEAFSAWNTWTVLGYCITAPIALILGIMGYRGAQNSRRPFLIAIGIAVIPFIILFIQFVLSFIK